MISSTRTLVGGEYTCDGHVPVGSRRQAGGRMIITLPSRREKLAAHLLFGPRQAVGLDGTTIACHRQPTPDGAVVRQATGVSPCQSYARVLALRIQTVVHGYVPPAKRPLPQVPRSLLLTGQLRPRMRRPAQLLAAGLSTPSIPRPEQCATAHS